VDLRWGQVDLKGGVLHVRHSPPTASANSADKLYEIILTGVDSERPRQAEKAVALCRRAWRVVHRLHPGEFDRDVPNPWDGVTIKRRTKARKPAVTREDVYRFATGAIEQGKPEAAGRHLFRMVAAA
jgi:hypothetical protein